MFSSQDFVTVYKSEEIFEGISDGVHSYNEYDHYIISGAGQVLMEAIDVNKDGKIDYVK